MQQKLSPHIFLNKLFLFNCMVTEMQIICYTTVNMVSVSYTPQKCHLLKFYIS